MSESIAKQPLPENTLRRSVLYRLQQQQGATFCAVDNGCLVQNYRPIQLELDNANRLGLADLSTLTRTGFKGVGAITWLASQQVTIPDTPNTATQQQDGTVVARLSNEECLILGNLEGGSTKIKELDSLYNIDSVAKTYHLPRADSHGWLAITGHRAPDMLAKVCGVDMGLEQFPDGQVAQTSVARVNGIVIRNDLQQTPCFYLLSDISSSEFLWECLLDAALEFDGQAMGIQTLQTLNVTN